MRSGTSILYSLNLKNMNQRHRQTRRRTNKIKRWQCIISIILGFVFTRSQKLTAVHNGTSNSKETIIFLKWFKHLWKVLTCQETQIKTSTNYKSWQPPLPLFLPPRLPGLGFVLLICRTRSKKIYNKQMSSIDHYVIEVT